MPQSIGKMGTSTSKSDAEDPMRIHTKCCKQVQETLAVAATAVAVIIDPSFLKQGKTEAQNVLRRVKQPVHRQKQLEVLLTAHSKATASQGETEAQGSLR